MWTTPWHDVRRDPLTTGVSVYPDDAFDSATLLARAGEALEEAIRSGPGSVVIYAAAPGEAPSVPA